MGLAMSRSLGDDIAHQAGVSSEPEMMEHQIDASDQVKSWYCAALSVENHGVQSSASGVDRVCTGNQLVQYYLNVGFPCIRSARIHILCFFLFGLL